MFSSANAYGLGSCSEIDNGNLSPRTMVEARAAAASTSHKEAERRRRKRINGHIATLKSLLPNVIKTDKASLLGEAVRRVRELNKAAAELTPTNHNHHHHHVLFPSETDELKVIPCEETGVIKATICCEDRPELVMELIEALKSVEAKVVRAEMSTMGGRTKSVLWVRLSVGKESDVGLATLRRGLKSVMDKSTLLAGSAQGLPGSKRSRYYPN